MLIPRINPVLLPSQRIIVALIAVLMIAAALASRPAASQTSPDRPVIDGAVVLSGHATEGGLIIAQAPPGTKVALNGSAIPVSPSGRFVVGFHRDQDDAMAIALTLSDGSKMTSSITPDQRRYDIQRIDGLATKMVTPPADVSARISRDAAMVRAARDQLPSVLGQTSNPDFFTGFDWPARGRISGFYGGQRILNGEPRAPHYGIDIAAPKGTPVVAPADGVITLANDLYYSGRTIIMAHGLGVNSAFLHLDDMTVAVGSFVKRGAVIGHVGSSGRSTGPHLDWRIDWQGRRLDAGLIAGPMNK